MTIKKKIFFSNTIMVFIALLILLGIGGILISIFKDEFLTRFSEGSEISEYVSEVEANLLDQNNFDLTMEEWSRLMNTYDFRIYAYNQNGRKMYDNLQHGEKEAVEVIDDKTFNHGEVKMYYLEGSTILATLIENNTDSYTLIAVNSPADNTFWGIDRGMFEMFIIVFLVTGILAIGAILACSQIFTKRLINLIMFPLDQLNAATVRIGEGNLTESINYENDDEFKPVCDSFDQMQNKVREGIEKQASYEKARTEMVSGISHDLRTPLTSIKGYIKGMIDGIANTEEKRQHYLKTAYKKSCDMDVLLSKLFYISKLETGNMPFFTQKTDIVNMINQYVQIKKSEGIDYNVVFGIKSVLKDKVYLDIDQDQIRRVFDNIIENSIKYAKSENLEIRFEMEVADNVFKLTIQDNGKGMEKEKIEHVFEQFYRGDESRNSKNDGSGLGLYVCKYIVEQQGGSIEAFSKNGFGVKIYLPIMIEEK